uniref:Uncharacterized protein n=1 Tax=Sphaerodactylus townsendi TaxID=933632 RepID=A0ACB8GDC4_9SAUR
MPSKDAGLGDLRWEVGLDNNWLSKGPQQLGESCKNEANDINVNAAICKTIDEEEDRKHYRIIVLINVKRSMEFKVIND